MLSTPDVPAHEALIAPALKFIFGPDKLDLILCAPELIEHAWPMSAFSPTQDWGSGNDFISGRINDQSRHEIFSSDPIKYSRHNQ